ncbi:MAG: hypothetical protein RR063_06700, partial [Anaerovoracaceae bacterium]
ILLEQAEPSDVWRASAFFKLIRYSYGSGCTSYGCQPFDIRKVFGVVWEASRRLKDTVVENKDFEALIGQYDRDDAVKNIITKVIVLNADRIRVIFDGGAEMEVELPGEQ